MEGHGAGGELARTVLLSTMLTTGSAMIHRNAPGLNAVGTLITTVYGSGRRDRRRDVLIVDPHLGYEPGRGILREGHHALETVQHVVCGQRVAAGKASCRAAGGR